MYILFNDKKYAQKVWSKNQNFTKVEFNFEVYKYAFK